MIKAPEGSLHGYGSRRWNALVAEAQFANNLIVNGLRHISRLPMGGGILTQISPDQTFPLYLGLHSFTSGLERLAKLALACDGFLRTGAFPKVKKFSHKISKLCDELENVDVSANNVAMTEYHQRPVDEYEPALITWLEEYAAGPGRYELLDSLASGSDEERTWDKWAALCAMGHVPASILHYIDLEAVTRDVALSTLSQANLESSADGLIESTYPLSSDVAAVVLAMHRRARWVASILDAVTYYRHEELPILREACTDILQETELFYAFEIARFSDPDVVLEEIEGHFSDYGTQ